MIAFFLKQRFLSNDGADNALFEKIKSQLTTNLRTQPHERIVLNRFFVAREILATIFGFDSLGKVLQRIATFEKRKEYSCLATVQQHLPMIRAWIAEAMVISSFSVQ